MSKIIVLDPGHYKGYNKGAVSGYAEGTVMFNYAYLLKDTILDTYDGCEVIITRKKVEDNPSLAERGKMAKDADLFLSLHSNAASPTGHGVSVFYSLKRKSDYDWGMKACEELAKLIQGGVRARGCMTREGSNGNDYYGVIRNSVAVNVKHSYIIEHGFHSCPDECAWLMDDSNLKEMAKLEAKLICEYLGCPKKDKATEAVKTGATAPKTGWRKDDKGRWRWYENGKMSYTRWVLHKGDWYYIMPDGTMAEDGWALIGKNWYYFDKDGAMQKSCWVEWEGDDYYLGDDGIMYVGTHEIDGTNYTFAESGKKLK